MIQIYVICYAFISYILYIHPKTHSYHLHLHTHLETSTKKKKNQQQTL